MIVIEMDSISQQQLNVVYQPLYRVDKLYPFKNKKLFVLMNKKTSLISILSTYSVQVKFQSSYSWFLFQVLIMYIEREMKSLLDHQVTITYHHSQH